MPRLSREARRLTKQPKTQERKPFVSSGEVRANVTCLMCGHSNSSLAFWEKLDSFDPEHPLGVFQEMGIGRGQGFRVTGQITGPEDIPEIFPILKRRYLEIGRVWLRNGWITEEELEGMK